MWSSPTIDLQRRVVYVATGNGYTEPADEASDAVIALDLDTGRRLWSKQVLTADHYVRERVRAFLARRHKVAGRGTRRFTWDIIHQDRGVLCLERLPRPAPLWASQ